MTRPLLVAFVALAATAAYGWPAGALCVLAAVAAVVRPGGAL